ncbi:MAG: hypothetical protein PHV34_13435 [Verrucomicrobiae bacterium]|nr:hypothetical protein [Verrucomicrobiae bacterium]
MAGHEKTEDPLLHLEEEDGSELWQEHAKALRTWDDLSLMQWTNQVLCQLHERSWRASHPFVMSYRLALTVIQQRDLWSRRLVSMSSHYQPAECCGAPSIPLVSHDICKYGLYCSNCGTELAELAGFPPGIVKTFNAWGAAYETYHQVAHWPDDKRRKKDDYEAAMETAREKALPLLSQLGFSLAPRFLEFYPAVFWEDGDDCLDIIPEDLTPPDK